MLIRRRGRTGEKCRGLRPGGGCAETSTSHSAVPGVVARPTGEKYLGLRPGTGKTSASRGVETPAVPHSCALENPAATSTVCFCFAGLALRWIPVDRGLSFNFWRRAVQAGYCLDSWPKPGRLYFRCPYTARTGPCIVHPVL